jgi:hypothetical protein
MTQTLSVQHGDGIKTPKFKDLGQNHRTTYYIIIM